jgi:DNA mismatch repair protein MutS
MSYSPMMLQYFEIKKDYQDALLFFRLGDFYELFFDDAQIASKELGLALTQRDTGKGKGPMCGVPHHAVEGYIERLVKAGFRVALCEQVSDETAGGRALRAPTGGLVRGAEDKRPKGGLMQEAEDKRPKGGLMQGDADKRPKGGLMHREVVRVFTPGTIFGDEVLNSYIMAVCEGPLEGSCGDSVSFGAAFCDVGTGDFFAATFDDFAKLMDEINKIAPIEIIVSHGFAKTYDISGVTAQGVSLRQHHPLAFLHDIAYDRLCVHFNKPSLECFGFAENVVGKLAVCAAGGLLDYLLETQKNSLSHIVSLEAYNAGLYMSLDKYVRRNLELFETLRGREAKGSLFWAMDDTKTPMGRRLLAKWILEPLLCIDSINIRQEAVAEYKKDAPKREAIRKYLSKIGDLERFCAKIVYRRINGRDLQGFEKSLEAVRGLHKELAGFGSSLNSFFYGETDVLEDVARLLDGAFLPVLGPDTDEGNLFAFGYNEELDKLRALRTAVEGQIEKYEEEERARLGIKNLKISFNKVFGYYIEVPNAHKNKVGEDYLPRQTLANCQRYGTEKLKIMETQILTANEAIKDLELRLFFELRNKIAEQVPRIKITAGALANIDVLQSMGEIADKYNYAAPLMNTSGMLEITGGRHPFAERAISSFVPNDICLGADNDGGRIAVITGPNMAGKSTYLRQAALMAIMAQMGSFIPACHAEMPIFDAVFTRVGAADDLSKGQSTFMVEMSELAFILSRATAQSLILLDEVGRGTGTTDGLAIALATIEYIAEKVGAKTLFATHYHELTAAADKIPGVINLSMVVEAFGGGAVGEGAFRGKTEGVKFLFKVKEGGTDKSHGIFVAKMAGLPQDVIERSQAIHERLVSKGAFDFDDGLLEETRKINYKDVQEQVKRYRLFLEEFAEMQLDACDIKKILDNVRALKEKADCLRADGLV